VLSCGCPHKPVAMPATQKIPKAKEYPVLNFQKDYIVYYINTDIVVKRPLNLKITAHYLLNGF
jgi:hypothetical protein